LLNITIARRGLLKRLVIEYNVSYAMKSAWQNQQVISTWIFTRSECQTCLGSGGRHQCTTSPLCYVSHIHDARIKKDKD
jgi:hypothetical protein